MSTYKLTYFNVTGLAESIRYMLNHLGIKFEDNRFSFDDWPKYKSGMFISCAIMLKLQNDIL